ncbi:SabA family sialic acid-binding adhesin [Helicobacter pylori]|uniref:SabA family sialic acid-binding adhesin n=1 Tax=Helicobacter pylori TaxID=210 RepID=UPI0039F0D555
MKKKMKKTLLTLSLVLAAPLLNAEDDGFYMSVGYQIGEATQMVKNTGALRNLADRYERLNNLITQYNYLNSLVNQANTPSAITGAINNLGTSATNLTSATTTSPAYQAVSLALNAAVGMWQVIAFGINCGPGPDESKNAGVQSFGNTPNYYNGGTTTTTCNGSGTVGVSGILSTEKYQELNQAYQIIQTALNQSQGGGMPALKDTTKTGVAIISDTIIRNATKTGSCQNQSGNEQCYTGGTQLPLTLKIKIENNAEYLLQQAATIINVLTTQNPQVAKLQTNHNSWGLGNKAGNVVEIFGQSLNAIKDMISNAQAVLEKTKQLTASEQTQIEHPSDFNPYNPNSNKEFAKQMLTRANAQAEILNLAQQVANISTAFKGLSKGI